MTSRGANHSGASTAVEPSPSSSRNQYLKATSWLFGARFQPTKLQIRLFA